jgi:transcriptional regulator with XRE-family HTH domain
MEKTERLKILRLLNGFTQAELAALATIPQASLAVMEKGKYGVAGDRGELIARLLGVRFEYLYRGTPPIDSSGPVAWIVRPPPRSQHLQTLLNDLQVLFPRFLIENKFTAVLTGILDDGGRVFLLGKDVARIDSTALPNPMDARPQDYFYSGLLLADKRLVDCVKTAFKTVGLILFPEISVWDYSLETFNTEALVSITQATHLDISYFKDNLAALRTPNKSPPSKTLSRVAISLAKLLWDVSKEYDLGTDDVQTIAAYFHTKCQELDQQSEAKISTIKLSSEISNKFSALGFKKKLKPPLTIPDSRSMDEFYLINEWFREFWITAVDSQKLEFVELIKKNTNFTTWCDTYDKEVEAGSRSPVGWFF